MARPFNNYGPGMKITDGRAIADLARNMIAGHDLVLYSDGSPTRTFCYVADAVTGYFLVLGKGGAGEPYNVGIDGPETSMADLAENVARLGRELFGYQGEVVLGESPEKEYLIDNPNRRSPDITKARTDLVRPQGRPRGGLATHPALVRRKPQRGGSMNKTEDGRRKTADGSKTHAPEQRLSFRPPVGKGPARGAAGR